MSAGPILRFTGEFTWLSNFDETPLWLTPEPSLGLKTVLDLPAWMTVDGHERIAELTNEVKGLVPRIVDDGSLCVPGVERPFQAWKTDDVEIAARILGAPTPMAAKKAGGKGGLVTDLRSNWAQQAMLHLQRVKYVDERLAGLLHATGFRMLVEGNAHGDTIWGAVWEGSRGWSAELPCWARQHDGTAETLRGHNWLGRLLMLVRAERDCGMAS